MADINLSGFDNEDNDYAFTLKVGTALSSTPFDLTDADLEAEFRDVKDDTLVLRLTTWEGDNRIQKSDAVNGKFTFHIVRGDILFVAKRVLKYDLILHANDSSRRLWGGKLKIAQGTTATIDP